AVAAYNVASQMYNRSHGFAPGSPKATSSIDRSALGLHATMLKLSPSIEMGGEHAMLRLEAIVGLGEHHRAIGVGLYPVDVAMALRRGTVVPYIVAGGTASWLDRTDVDGEVGALVSARAALGVRIARRLVIEAGYSFYALGGVLDTTTLHAMSTYDPTGNAP